MSNDFLQVNYDCQNKIWKSVNYPYKNLTNRSVSEAFLQSMRSLDPQKVLEYHYDVEKEKCVKDLYQESIIVANNLQRLGMRRGDVVVLFSGYNYMTSSLTFGTILMGGVINFFELKLEDEYVDKLFETLQPFIILYEEVFLPKILSSLKRCKLQSLKYMFTIDGSEAAYLTSELLKSFEIIEFEKFQAVKVEKPDEEIAFLVLTSGTTGLPKATQLTHCSLLNGVYVWWENSYNYEPLSSSSIIFSLSPLRWISQVELLLQSAILGIKRICANKSANGPYGLQILRKTKPTHIFSGPSVFSEILLELKEGDIESLDSLKYIMLGGERPSSAMMNLCQKYAINGKLFCSYGMSEVSGAITNDSNISGGKMLHGFEMQVVDVNLQPLGHNHHGQLAVKTPYPLIGYRGYIDNAQCFLENGFFLTGDYGYFDDDNTLHLLGHLKDLIKYKNIILIPNIIESLVQNLAEISSACLVGYHDSAKDPDEVAALFVAPKQKVNASHEHIASKIREMWTGYLSEAEISLIRSIYFESILPLTTCGKIDRIKLKKFAEKMAELN